MAAKQQKLPEEVWDMLGGGHAFQHARGSGRDGAGDPVAACGVEIS